MSRKCTVLGIGGIHEVWPRIT